MSRAVRLVALVCILIFHASTELSAQPIQIKRNNSFGLRFEELGKQRLMLRSRGDLASMTTHLDSGYYQNAKLFIHPLDLSRSSSYPYNFYAELFELGGFVEDEYRQVVIIGSRFQSFSPDSGRFQIAIQKGIQGRQKYFSGDKSDMGIGIQQTPDSGFLVVANVLSTNLGFQNKTGVSQIWLGKLDNRLEQVWSKLLTTTHKNEALDFKKTPDGNFILSGTVSDVIPFGPANSYQDGLVMKIKEDGTILWQQYLGGNGNDRLERVVVAANGEIFAAGITKSNQGAFANNRGDADGWITKLTNDGTPVYDRVIGGSGEDELKSIVVSSDGIITAGGSTFSTDGDMADNKNRFTSWVTSFKDGSPAIRQGYLAHDAQRKYPVDDIVIADDGNIYCVLLTDSSNTLTSYKFGGKDSWIVNLGESNKILGSAFLDLNKNGSQDPDEKPFSAGKYLLTRIGTTDTQQLHTNTGRFSTVVDTGAYTVSFVTDRPYYERQPPSKTFTFNGYDKTDSFVVAVTTKTITTELTAQLIPLSIPRPGFDLTYRLNYSNIGTTSPGNVQLKFTKDPRIIFLSGDRANSVISGDTLSWNIGSLQPLDSGSILINARLKAPPMVNLGDTLSSEVAIIHDLQKQVTGSDTSTLREIVMGSFDPNDKTEFHGGQIDTVNLKAKNLTYLIRFQNTGTDTAFNISVRDTLDRLLNVGSLKMLAASHPFTLQLKNENQLEWKFNDIKLPDSNRNEPMSHGYILYSITPLPSLKPGDVINNRAGIYFDFNLPIQTNTTSTRVIEDLLPRPLLTGLQAFYCQNSGLQKARIPNVNLAGSATIEVLINNKLLSVGQDGQFSFDPATLEPGLQSLVVNFKRATTSSSLTTSFTVNTPVVLEVELKSNLATVMGNATNLVLIATPVTGAGAAPLYTFSTDRLFVNMIQLESNLTMASLSSALLKDGENWVYVQMKSSEDCVASQFAVDSIQITKLSVTSIVDVIYPGTRIIAYPNPFHQIINLKGLQPSVSYGIQLMDATGKVQKFAQTKGSSRFDILTPGLPGGNYYLRLYDLKKKRLIGTISLLHL